MLSRYDVQRSLSAFSPLPASPLSSTMNRLFHDLETAFIRQGTALERRARSAPRVLLRERRDAVSVFADVPGASLDDIDLQIEGQTVTLKVTPKSRPVPEGFSALRRERQPAAIEWSFEVPFAVDAAAASAALEQGRLSINLPRAPEAKPRNIAVKAR